MTWIDLLSKKLGHRRNIPSVIAYSQNNPQLSEVFTSELNQAIRMYNDYALGKLILPSSIKSDMLKNSNHLKDVVRVNHLPPTVFPFKLQEDPLDSKYWELMNNFDFFDEKWSPAKMLAALVIASYRSDMLASHPDWHHKGAQIASALEEMLTLLALSGSKTHIFKATKHWIEDYAGEDFDVRLSQLAAKL